jgi:hypothetical protein
MTTEEMIQKVTERRDSYIQQRLQMFANVSALNGAIEDCEHWLERLAEVDKPATQEPTVGGKSTMMCSIGAAETAPPSEGPLVSNATLNSSNA